MYAPLGRNLGDSKGTLSKLQFAVRRVVSVDRWIEAADRLLDFRMDSEFRLRGSLRKETEEHLLEAWKPGKAEEVAAGRDTTRSKVGIAVLAARAAPLMPAGQIH